MKRGLIAGTVGVFALVMLGINIQGGDEKPKITIKTVMQKAMAGSKEKPSLCTKVAKGEASAKEKAALIEYFTALTKCTPPMGEADSWKEKTGALLAAAKADDGAALGKAANCAACHKEHKLAKKKAE